MAQHAQGNSEHHRFNQAISPQSSYERNGDADDMVFPCGWINKNGKIYMYYGATDFCIALAIAKLKDILDFMQK